MATYEGDLAKFLAENKIDPSSLLGQKEEGSDLTDE